MLIVHISATIFHHLSLPLFIMLVTSGALGLRMYPKTASVAEYFFYDLFLASKHKSENNLEASAFIMGRVIGNYGEVFTANLSGFIRSLILIFSFNFVIFTVAGMIAHPNIKFQRISTWGIRRFSNSWYDTFTIYGPIKNTTTPSEITNLETNVE